MNHSLMPAFSDPAYESEFEGRRSHAYNKINWHIPEKNGRFLDIGCGSGNAVVAALQNGFDFAVGVDRDFSEFKHFDLENRFGSICSNYEVDYEKTLLIEGDIFRFKFSDCSFDCVMMLDSIEHVPNPMDFINYAYRSLRNGGYFLLDTCPLYYSMVGHHLFEHFSMDEPWAHLKENFKDEIKNRGVDDWNLQRFDELNKVKHKDIIEGLKSCGFQIVYEHRSQPTDEILEKFQSARDDIVWDGSFEEAELFEDWILVVAQKAG